MKKTSLYQFFRAREGVVMTEFLLCLPMLILLLFLLFESARLFITSISLDLAILKSIQRAKNTPNVNYQATLATELAKQTNQLSPFFDARGLI
ncbi:TadE/TadG family type IV pilus assembly protein [Candidatus Williamhamiltonella defendens]|uniref:TadE/TadG family type IV pilus assembly protein n=1 Tax=Candidatus Williamhamiltonella defendens TaxID=138072 RepID=UPI001F20A93E|nr:TadE/TadG family type IV pilus assembly protein [Candidatus Hamiltonella defensa]